jgi:hypothetical protein
MWEERMRAELVLAEKNIQMEKEAKASMGVREGKN